MTERSRSMLFLMEQLFVITVFAFCAAVCVKIFAASYLTARETSDLNNAVIIAAGGAEAYKAAQDINRAAELLGGSVSDNAVEVYYDGEWLPCDESLAEYNLRLVYTEPEGSDSSVVYGDIAVSKTTGEEIIAVTTAARRDVYE